MNIPTRRERRESRASAVDRRCEADAQIVGKLSTRETLIREIQQAVRDQLYSQEAEKSGWGRLNGPLGEQIAFAAGTYSLAKIPPEQIAEGICNWLDKNFLPDPAQEDGSREGHEDASPPPCKGGGDGSRVAASNIVGSRGAN